MDANDGPPTAPSECPDDRGVFSSYRYLAHRPPATDVTVGGAVSAVQEVLAGVPGSVTFLQPVPGPDGRLADLRYAAASPDAVDIGGRRGQELIGLRVLETYPGAAGTELWQGYLKALDTGEPYEGELAYEEVAVGIPHRSHYRVRAVPCQGGLVVSWTRLDTGERERRRLGVMQRLARMGWADWDLVRNVISWSDEVYTVFNRDPALGPMTLEELPTHVLAEDLPALGTAVRHLLGDGEPIDHTFRITTPDGQVRHLRIVAEAELDAHGGPVEVHGFFQDLTAAKHTERQLLDHQQAVLAQQSQLAAERGLAARLQDTLLPVSHQTLLLAGLTVDVAYQPLQEGLKLGGDWYSAVELPDGDALFVVGDVAGHGLDAVATMALLRFTAKGMAITGTPLPSVLARLNTLLLHSPDQGFDTATMVMAHFDPTASRLTWVQAGHPPPLLVRDGRSRFLAGHQGTLLGAVDTARYEASTVELRPGDHLLLYTDGLVETPGEPIDAGLARLARIAPAHVNDPHCVDALVRETVGRRAPRDDICVLHIAR
ncbi:Putative serine/threonine protein phosphatase [Kitasatospora sp. MMS16-BH015]|uniref:PP2C family protein-serine/threonine phosphatase n=1 Tax=Kitasatospora sp. MMS16-BH015 TaxID=2018025 RepID=UPI000CA35B28|nr:SpoIIE family protein phosphatase [Kitasatospora sp. MMS16-BH015]AUG75593.1 Putative serine/threonine protein phosphatase [Kitasatospora sp. MMS16-BH015]